MEKYFDSEDRYTFISTALIMLAVHGFAFANLMYSHDSLYFYDTYNAAKVDLGRWLFPLIKIIRNEATPWMMGVLSTIYVSLAVVFVKRLLRFDQKKGFCVSVLFASNIALISLFCTYSADADADCLALLLSCLAVYTFERCSGKLKTALPILFIVCTLALYQAYICVTIGLFLIILIYKTAEINDKAGVNKVIMTGIKEVAVLAISVVVYIVSMIIAAKVFGVELSNDYNGPGSVASHGIKDIILLIPKAYGSFGKRLLLPYGYSNVISTVTSIVLLLLILVYAINYIKICKVRSEAQILSAALLLILPLGLNAIYVISFGMIHQLMIFAFCLFFLLPLVFDELINNSENGYQGDENRKKFQRLLSAAIVCILIICFNNAVFANGAYTHKKLVYDNTILHAQNVWEDVNSIDGYVEGETPVVFAGEFTESKAVYQNMLTDKYQNALLGSFGSSITYEDSMIHYFEGILGRKMKIEHLDSSNTDKGVLADMPEYPSEGYCRYSDGKVIVKMSNKKIEE
ncbi:glucosyltransferase domain-containing protein [Butyrivibrio sp. AE3006]|uniref:glucosyltransferase domain-containing protein n=1 Tax=Butyrivibrio sp. AE3006 TaxID=1280673 RepID=UPI00040A4056|nr:glucosyltransferase domain-containing protein [Butyrivibrio sp. AE3006]